MTSCFLLLSLGIFGMDIGGTLSKIVYFERKLQSDPHKSDGNNQSTSSVTSNNIQFDQMDSPAHQQALEEFHLAMKSENVMGSSGSRDNALSFYSNILGGRLHFLRFETRKMEMTIQNLSVTDITENIKSIGCTGGGAHKYQHIIHEYLDIDVLTFDELQCLIRGMQFVLMNYSNECYTYRFFPPPSLLFLITTPPPQPLRYDKDAEDQEKIWQRDAKEFVRKVQIPYHVLRQSPFPYLVVNIGSGVSILKVTSPGKFERISGTSIGGGTYWGLCRLFTRCSTFEDVLGLAENGDNKGVDMLVSDIYGKGYDQMNLKASMVASSFGKLVMAENPHDGLKEEDLAIALLMMITNNIGQVLLLTPPFAPPVASLTSITLV
jgi:type II pantothenate kinase